MAASAIVPAAGFGRRLGRDKATIALGGRAAVDRVVGCCRAAGAERVVVVRRPGAEGLPPLAAEVVECGSDEMIDSLVAGWRRLAPGSQDRILVHPIDYPLVGDRAARALLDAATGARSIRLPLCLGRTGHPVVLAGDLGAEVATAATLRDVVHRDPLRVAVVPVDDPWTLLDVDGPAALRAAEAKAGAGTLTAPEQMRRHRSRRCYREDPVDPVLVEWIVDCARHASTSSFIQAYSVVAVTESGRRGVIAALCADQDHVRAAPCFLAVCADLHKVELACRLHDRPLHAGGLEAFVQATVDAALLGQNVQLAAEAEGLGACMIGAARDHPGELAELLGLPPHAWVVFGMALGYPSDDPVPRGRMPLDGVLFDDRYRTDALSSVLAAADGQMRAWARETNARGAGRRPVDESRGWTDRMAHLWGRAGGAKQRRGLAAELARRGFGFGE